MTIRKTKSKVGLAIKTAVVILSAVGIMCALWGAASAGPEPVRAAAMTANLPSCDPNWVVQSPVTPTYALLSDLAVVSTNDIWAVGGNINTSGTLTEHWDGSAWSTITSPGPGTNDNLLEAVDAIAANDVWAVGEYRNQGGTLEYQALTMHWDGTQWTTFPASTVNANEHQLYDVAALAPNNVWAVGYYEQTAGSNSRTLIEHWNGTAWSVVTSPNPGGATSVLLMGIDAVSPTDIWAVGQSNSQTLIEHWDGTTWSIVTSPNTGAANWLYDVDALSAGDVWAVGFYVDGSVYHPLIEHWDGIGWSIIPSPNVGAQGSQLFGIEVLSTNDAWAVGGFQGTGLNSGTLVLHWNGSTWSVVSSPSPGNGFQALSAVAAVSAADVWAVGYYSNDTNPSQPLAERYNPCTPTATPTPVGTPIACPVEFPDVLPGSTFYDFVECLACRGIVSGLPDGNFGPNNPVTRGQLSKIVSNAAGYAEDHTEQSFEDVPPGSTFHLFVERLYSRDIIAGYTCGGTGEPCGPGSRPYFRPGANVTRAQTAKIVTSARGLPMPPPNQQTFQDVPGGSTFWEYVEALANAGAISGYACGGVGEACVPPGNRPYFRPGSQVTRGQSAKIVSSAFFSACTVPPGKR